MERICTYGLFKNIKTEEKISQEEFSLLTITGNLVVGEKITEIRVCKTFNLLIANLPEIS